MQQQDSPPPPPHHTPFPPLLPLPSPPSRATPPPSSTPTSPSPLLLLLLPLLACLVTHAHCTCLLPPFLQQRSAPWAASYGEHAQLVMYVKETFMTISQQGDDGDIMYTRKCEERAPEGKFLMRHIQAREQPRYLCMQFLRRSKNIVQIKASVLSAHKSLELCEERAMALDPWPIVHMSQSPHHNIPCPLHGGYNLLLLHPNHSALCPDASLLTRLESDCEPGEGIVLDFRQPECIPPRLPREVRQQVFCIAHWTQGRHSFVIVQHGSVHHHTWCLRLTGPLTHPSHALLLLDLLCDPSDVITATSNFYRLQLTRRVYVSACDDDMDSEKCRSLPHICQTPFKRHCARTCGVCGREQGGDCAFEEPYRGLWVDSTRSGDTQVKVGAYSMHVQHLGSYDCLRVTGSQRHRNKRVLVRIDENGCYPRYACTEMTKVSSSVMRFRMGDRVQWPLPSARDHKDHVCAKDHFRSRDALQPHVQRAPRVLVKASGIHRVSCDLPRPLHHGTAFREEGQSCSGCLTYQPSLSRDRFVIRPHNCSLTPHAQAVTPHHVTTMEFSCVATLTLANHSQAVITSTGLYSLMGRHLAWLFTPDGHVMVLKAGDLLQLTAGAGVKVELLEAQFTLTPHPHCRPPPPPTTTTIPHQLTHHPLFPSLPTLRTPPHHPPERTGPRSSHVDHDVTRMPPPLAVTSRVGVSYREWGEGEGTPAARGPEVDSSVEGKGEREEGAGARGGGGGGRGTGRSGGGGGGVGKLVTGAGVILAFCLCRLG